MKKFFLIILLFSYFSVESQIFKKVYDEVFKYSTIYVAGDVKTPYRTQRPQYFVRTNPDNLYAVPEIVDNTIYHEFDYRVGFGIRRIARFDYEIKARNYYDGNENQVALSSPTSAVKGLEYLFHWEKERQRSDVFTNHRVFVRHTGKHHIAKVELRQEGNIDFEYSSAELRFRLPIGKNFSISVGAIYRTHEKSFGYNPISLWLNETNEDGFPVNPWYSLGYQYGYSDSPYTSTIYNSDGTTSEIFNYLWQDSEGTIVAYTDEDFRDRIFGELMNRYNNEIWDELDSFGEIAPIVGFDYYVYKNKFWFHTYANYILPHHKYIQGDERYTYLHRNSWEIENYNIEEDGRQWDDWQVGLITGWNLTKSLGLFIEGEYTKFWDSEVYNSSIGLNLRL
jgi:hypothetical protein|tara:strand:+ start:3169 stop:4350 length:1182 start_codon:yes stop_codon:yes gene_type:complete